MHASLQFGKRVAGQDRHLGGGQHWSGVDPFIGHQMHHHTGVCASARLRLLECPLDRMHAGQLTGQCRMQVHDHARKPAEEAEREHAHPAGQHHPIGVEAADDVGEAGVVVGAGFVGAATDVHGG